MTWVRTKLALEALQPGEELEVVSNVPRNCAEEGHGVGVVEPLDGQRHLLIVRKRGA